MAKQVTKKGALKKGIGAYKEKSGMSNTNLVMCNADKPMSWYEMPKAFQEILGLPGIPMGTVISVYGHSNTGKTTLINHSIVACQKRGDIPIIFDTENAFSFQYARQMGFECEPVYGDVTYEVYDEKTGEIVTKTENTIINWEGNFLYFNNRMLAEKHGNFDYITGKTTATKRKVAVVEDIAREINELLDNQDEIGANLLFIVDSIGSIQSMKSYASKTGNNMFDAGAISVSFNEIVNNKIPASKKVGSNYTNTMLYINKVWMDSMTNPTGPAIMRTKGGNSLHYATRLQILAGKKLTAGIKRLQAVSQGATFTYATVTNLSVEKNHLNAPHNVTYSGQIVATDIGFIGVDEVEDYKKTHIKKIIGELKKLLKSDAEIQEEDIKYVEEEVIEE